MKASDLITCSGAMLKSLVKIAVGSRCVNIGSNTADSNGKLIILGNGPSLAQTIDEKGQFLSHSTCMAVNFAANAPEFNILRPSYYIMADPHFFLRADDPNVQKLYSSLSSANWPITLLVPREYRKAAIQAIDNKHLNIRTFNFNGLEGPDWFENICYRLKLGMPRPRNVLIPAIMCGIWLGYNDIYIAGADHSWLQSIWVNERNEVVSVQPHFYKEDQKEEKRVRSEYTNYRLHQILYSFHVAFKSYFAVKRFADRNGVKITNVTPGSYIDAFPRGEL